MRLTDEQARAMFDLEESYRYYRNTLDVLEQGVRAHIQAALTAGVPVRRVGLAVQQSNLKQSRWYPKDEED